MVNIHNESPLDWDPRAETQELLNVSVEHVTDVAAAALLKEVFDGGGIDQLKALQSVLSGLGEGLKYLISDIEDEADPMSGLEEREYAHWVAGNLTDLLAVAAALSKANKSETASTEKVE